MNRTKIQILEKRPYWYSELQRTFQEESVQVQFCNSYSQLELFYQENSNSDDSTIGIIDFALDPAECLLFLGKYAVDSPISTIIIGLPKYGNLEWTLRELGVTQILSKPFSSVQLNESCRFILNHLTENPG